MTERTLSGSGTLRSTQATSSFPAISSAWAAEELGRGRLLTETPFFIGNPWALVGYSQVGFDALVQAASWAGVYGVGFPVVCINAGLAELWLARGRDVHPPHRFRIAAVALLPALVILAVGAIQLRLAETGAGPDASRVALVQGNLALGSQWRSDLYGRNLETYLRLTLDAIRALQPDATVIMMTGYHDVDTPAGHESPTATLHKPFSYSELGAAIEETLGSVS